MSEKYQLPLGKKFWREFNFAGTKFGGTGGNLIWRLVNFFQIWQEFNLLDSKYL